MRTLLLTFILELAEDGVVESLDASPFKPLGLEFGERPKDGFYFVPFKTVQKYPHLFVGRASKDQVHDEKPRNRTIFKFPLTPSAGCSILQRHFTQRSCLGFVRDINTSPSMYWSKDAHCNHSFSQQDPSTARDPLLLVPTAQFKQYLNVVNSRLQKQLTIPRDGAKGKFFISFGEFDTPRPRYLGRANSVAALDALKKRGCTLPPEDLGQLPFNSAQLFREKMEEIYRSVKIGMGKDPEKLRQMRLERQKGWSRMFKRVQRYLGLRQAISHVPVSYGGQSSP
jgi:hypothetical protein